jgi:ATP-dependent helicase/nuclease subunit A
MSRDTALEVSRQASRPQQNATIRASAGTGKTFLLVTRLLRLLLSGTEPAGLLAITFTRKAAAEMQQRLQQRLLEYLRLDDATLDRQLSDIGVTADAATRQRARLLFEQLLRNDRRPRITTFHAFCQDILRRFPLEADVPPGFALLENTGLLMQQAWDGLWYDTTLDLKTTTGNATTTALQQLLLACGGIDSCRKSLFAFLHHRSDWWAYTRAAESHQAADWASEHLRGQLGIDAGTSPSRSFFNATRTDTLRGYHDLLLMHDNATNRDMCVHINTILKALQQTPVDSDALLRQTLTICYTQSGTPRSIKESRARARAMGETGQQRFLELHAELLTALDQAIDAQRRLQTWQLSTAWYQAGQQLLDHFQRLKQEQRLLDFTDLEWRACRLLNDGQHSHWIQYKLDQRINHILVDEFQDTNPTQWRLLLPLLQELAAHGGHGDSTQQQRSVFLVGDEKQSIYRFRRADPRLFETARHWLSEHVGASEYPLSVSWRSSPAIIDVVNRVFGPGEDGRGRLPDFPVHDTHRKTLWGQVEMLPLIPYETAADDDADGEPAASTALRNPLLQPRVLAVREQHLAEGRQICAHIQRLMTDDPGLRYDDIMILIRQRTHLHDFEQALREAGIPYVGNGKKTLLDTLEIQDMVALLQTLVSPGNNLALAQTLRSPLFACSDDDLMQIAQQHRNNRHDPQADSSDWMTALQQLTRNEDHHTGSAALQRAARWLPHWYRLTQQLPVHDLLDAIYSEGNVEARFSSAFPPHLRPRVQANLIRFIELALEIDSGRYPSLPAFLNQLQRLQQHASDNLSQTSPTTDPVQDNDKQNAVQILTVHAAKGLEAPIVFIADSGYKKPTARAWQALIDWPSDAEQPACFLLTGRSSELDDWSRQRLDDDAAADQREDANLLYVALTRTRQQLIISGCAHNGEQPGWYQHIAAAFKDLNAEADGRIILSRHGDKDIGREQPLSAEAGIDKPWQNIPAALSQPLANIPVRGIANTTDITLNPSQSNRYIDQAGATATGAVETDAARTRGIAIHRLLELCTATATSTPMTVDQAITQLAHEQSLGADHEQCQTFGREVSALLDLGELQPVFNPAHYQRAMNEVALQYRHRDQYVYGIIDRLVINPDSIIVIDYKTHSEARPDNVTELAAAYREQMHLYAEGIRQLWPDKKLKILLVFTACGSSVELEQ